MKHLLSLILCGVLVLGLVGCGSQSTSHLTASNYADIIAQNRNPDDNSVHTIFTLENGSFSATSGVASDLSSQDIAQQGQLSLDMLGISTEDVSKAAFSVSLMNVQSYGIAIIQPEQGKTDAVKQSLTTFIEAQKSAQENYLADQYAIAKAAKLETLKTGEVVLVMCSNQDTVYNAIQAAVK